MSEAHKPTGATTVTVVFTDLVSSTALLSRLGPAEGEALLREHMQELRSVVADHGALMAKDLGDGIMAVFGGVQAGLDAAVTIQQAVDRHNRGGREILRIRVGVATGDAFEDRGDYHGEAVVEAARVCAVAEGGHLLATDAVRFLARRTAHRFSVVGERILKGLPEPVLIVEVGWDPLHENPSVPLPPRLAGPYGTQFVGRAPERAGLEQLLTKSWAGDRHGALIAGEPGVGKTRLCADLASSANKLGATVLYGRCDEELGRPYQPWVESLGYLLTHFPPVMLNDFLEQHGEELAPLLPDLAPGMASRSSDPETDRYRLWGAVARLLAHVSVEAPVVLVLDDLQWADRETIHLLRHLFGLDGPMRVLILATYRDSELRPDHPLADLLAWLRRERRVQLIPLTGLAPGEIVDQMESLAGRRLQKDGLALADALWQETGGNPFFASEILRHLSETDAIARGADGTWVAKRGFGFGTLPASVREVIGHRVRRLGPEAEHLLGAASVIGHYFDLDLVAAAAGLDEDAALGVLETAVAAALVTEAPDTVARFGFNHVLIQHTIYDGLSATRRQRLHRRVAESLEEVCGDDPGDRVVELARHWAAVATSSEAQKAVRYAALAGDSALKALGPDEALRYYTQALGLLDESSRVDHRIRCQLLVNLGIAQRQTGDPAYRKTLFDAGVRASQLLDTNLVVRAALAIHRGFYASSNEIDRERVSLIEAALGMIDGADSPEKARLLATLASELTFHPDHERRKALAAEAIAVARRTNDPAALVDAICIPRLAVHLPDTLEERLAQTAEAVELARTVGDPSARFWANHTRRYPLLMAGEIDEADRCLEESQDLVAEIYQPALLWSLTLYRGVRALHAGDATEAEYLADNALKLAQHSGQPDFRAVNGAQMLFIRWHQGRLAELIPLLQQIRAANPNSAPFSGALAMAYAETGDHESARPLLDQAKQTGFRISFDYVYTMTMSYWAQTAAEVADEEASNLLYQQLLPWHDRVGFTGVAMTGSVAHYLGRLATVLGQVKEAEAHFAEARAMHERLKAPFFVAQTNLEWGRLLRSSDPVRSRELLRTANDLAAKHQCARIERVATAALSDVP